MKRWFLCCIFGLAVQAAAGQAWKGMVWAVPADDRQAEADLRAMRDIGVEAVRVGLVTDEALLALADTLGLHLFQELPLDALPAPALQDTLAYAMGALEAVLARARRHPSIRHLGLARRSDTSDPAACAYFEQLAARAHAAGVKVYYVSLFKDGDRCRDRVDFVLWDGLDGTAGEIPRGDGLATLGTWVAPDAPAGLRVPHSAEAQARYLETHLRAWLEGAPAPPPVFVHRWRDAGHATLAGGPESPDPYGRRYGLLDRDGAKRPAFEVVKGLYTSRQRVFAFPAGRAPDRPVSEWVLLGWGMFLMLGIYYARAPRFRFMVPRYFTAHGFYREAIRQGRDVLPVASALLLVMMGLSTGMLGSVLAEAYAADATVLLFLKKLPAGVLEAVVLLLTRPWLLLLLLGSVYVLGVALWALVLGALSRRYRTLMPGQVLMLVVWPRWVFLPVLVGTMVVSALPPDTMHPARWLLAVAWLVLTVWATVRTLYDYAMVTRASLPGVLLAGLANPLWTVLLVLAALATFWPEARFFWHTVGS